MGVSTQQAGIIIAFIITVCLVILVAMATKGNKLEVGAPLTIMLSILFFVFIGWFPGLLGSVLAVLCAAFMAKVLTGG